MKRVTILAIGKFKEDFLLPALNEYKKRLTRFCNLNIIELPSSTIKAESELLLLHKIDFLLDINGQLLTSPSLSDMMEQKYTLGNTNLTFAIGGSDGVSQEVKSNSGSLISFGRITYPHQLMRVVLLEQIYRAFTITCNLPYHK